MFVVPKWRKSIRLCSQWQVARWRRDAKGSARVIDDVVFRYSMSNDCSFFIHVSSWVVLDRRLDVTRYVFCYWFSQLDVLRIRCLGPRQWMIDVESKYLICSIWVFWTYSLFNDIYCVIRWKPWQVQSLLIRYCYYDVFWSFQLILQNIDILFSFVNLKWEIIFHR